METHREDIKYCAFLIDLAFSFIDILVDYSMNPVFKIMLDLSAPILPQIPSR